MMPHSRDMSHDNLTITVDAHHRLSLSQTPHLDDLYEIHPITIELFVLAFYSG